MENRIPSTDPSTWNGAFKVGDKVKIRINFSSTSDVNSTFSIIQINRSVSQPMKLDEDGRNIGGMKRPENPSGILYVLSNGAGNWEGKDLELVSSSQSTQSNDIIRDSNVSKDINSLSSFMEFDTQKDKIIILRVKPPQTGGTPPPDDGTPPPPPEPQPDNIEDPTEETPPPEGGEQGGEQGGEGEGGEGEGGEGEGGEGEGGDAEGGEGEGGEGEGGDAEGGKGEGGKEGGNNEGEGADSEFGDDDDMQSLEEMLKKIKEDFDRGKTTKDIQNQQDLDSLANALSVPKDQIKNIFKTKAIVMSAIGRRNIFGTDNEQRLNDTLNEIFK